MMAVLACVGHDGRIIGGSLQLSKFSSFRERVISIIIRENSDVFRDNKSFFSVFLPNLTPHGLEKDKTTNRISPLQEHTQILFWRILSNI